MSKRIALFPALLLALLVIVATALTWMNFSQALPRSQWAQAAWSPDIDVIEQMIFHYSLLPRLAISLLVGAGLGLVGVLFQQVLRNPLAEPTTLGVATGAQLGITVTTLWAIPGAMASQFAALAGACVWRRVGETAVAGNADSRGVGSEPLLRRNQSVTGYLPS